MSIAKIQAVLDFEGWESPQFRAKSGLGRVGLAGFLLGCVFGIHLGLIGILALISNDAIPHRGLLLQWSVYVVALSGFHFSEFLVTALYKPDSVSYDSYVINHSPAYTLAALASWTEFWVESAMLARPTKFRAPVFAFGMALVAMGQFFRSAAMWTCKSNFNHIIMEECSCMDKF